MRKPASSLALPLLHDISLLFRFRVSVMVTASAMFGYALVRPHFEAELAGVAVGCFLLAAACSAWNQAQEKDIDAHMARTANRPVASGRMSVTHAALWGAGCALPALAALYITGHWPLIALGIAIIVIYNGIYTPLKKQSGFALLAGAIVGALPVVMGWVAARGALDGPLLAMLYSVYLLWQIPHFWLRVERHQDEYEKAGLPVPPLQISRQPYNLLLGIWFCAFAAALLMIPVFPFLQSTALRVLLSLIGMGTTLISLAFFRYLPHKKGSPTRPDSCAHSYSALPPVGLPTPPGCNFHAGAYTSITRRYPLCVVDGAMLIAMGIVLTDRILATY